MTYETKMTKSLHGSGWICETMIPMGFTTQEGEAMLKVTTMKRSSGYVATIASAVYAKQDMITHLVFQSFQKTLQSIQVKQATAKVVEQLHKDVFPMLAEIAEQAKAHEQKEAA